LKLGSKKLSTCPQKGRKIPKTLSGIETGIEPQTRWAAKQAGKYLKPYQGLKPRTRKKKK